MALAIAIDDITAVTASESPVATIMQTQLGPVKGQTLLGVIMFAFFGAGLVTLTSCSRVVFAMSATPGSPAVG